MPRSEPTSSPRILRIPKSDESDTYVLLHVSRFNSTLLDLNIAATEGETPYTTIVRQARLKNLRAKSSQDSDDEWVQTVSYVFGQLPASVGIPAWASGIEASASISGSDDDVKEMAITIRKRIQDITQKLGTITLKQDDEQAIELFDWNSIAVTRADVLEEQLSSLTESFRAAENTIQILSKQLEEFISAKSQHENQLVADFVQLLNGKKLKIRNQQRLLASAKVDSSKVSEIQKAAPSRHGKSTERGPRSKRAAKELSDGVFERMEVDHKERQDAPEENSETDDGARSTPDPLENEENTASEEELSPPPVARGQEQEASSGRPSMKEPAPPPPRRELPFSRTREEQAQIQPQADRMDKDADETAGETDDDEL